MSKSYTLESTFATINRAFVPLVQRITQEDGGRTQESVTIRTWTEFDGVDGKDVATLTAEYFGKTATFNYLPIVKTLFRDALTQPTIMHSITDGLYTDHNLVSYVGLPYDIVDEEIEDDLYVLVNATAQIGESGEVPVAKFLTNFERIKRYEGFPISLSWISKVGAHLHLDDHLVLNNASFNIWREAELGTRHLTYTAINAKHGIALTDTSADPYLRNSDGDMILTAEQDPIFIDTPPVVFDHKTLIVLPAPKHPFYVRWINQQGGWDYWMFACRQVMHRERSGVTVFSPYLDDIADAHDKSEIIAMEIAESMAVSTGLINANEWECISRILYSPRIERYDPHTGKWFTLMLEKGNAEKNTASPTGEIQLTFSLIDPLLQV